LTLRKVIVHWIGKLHGCPQKFFSGRQCATFSNVLSPAALLYFLTPTYNFATACLAKAEVPNLFLTMYHFSISKDQHVPLNNFLYIQQ